MVVGDPSTSNNAAESLCETIWDGSPTANHNLGADSMVQIYAHEILEIVSDYASAWYFDSEAVDSGGASLHGEENGDACQWTYGRMIDSNSNVQIGSKNFLIQQNWVPKHGCQLSLRL